MNLLVLGPGSSLNHDSELIVRCSSSMTTLAFQNVFPNCLTHFGIIPDIWLSGDPNAYMEGFHFLLNNINDKDLFQNMEILIPSMFTRGLVEYRRYCGTTPLLRSPGAWNLFEYYLGEINKHYKVRVVECTTTKFLKTSGSELNSRIFDLDSYERFMHHTSILGTVEFDNESVIGDRYKWGLENKLTSIVFPFAYNLNFKNIYIAGFDFQGPRFYSDDARHPWSDETQKENVAHFPLTIVEKWVQWNRLHGMKFTSVVKNELTLLNKVLPYQDLRNIIQGVNNVQSI